MTTYRLVASQTIDRPIEEVFAFFSRPENLGRITPSAMGFEQVSTDLEMRAGLLRRWGSSRSSRSAWRSSRFGRGCARR